MIFKKLEKEDAPLLRNYFDKYNIGSCDYSIGGVMLWRDFFKTEYAVVSDTLIFRYEYYDGKTSFSAPIGENCAAAYALAESVAEGPMVFYAVPTEKLDCVLGYFGEERLGLAPVRDWFDYLYDPEDMRTFAGKRFSAKRNHINKFNSLYPNHEVSVITEGDVPEIKRFLASLPANEPSLLGRAEETALRELLDNYAFYNFKGIRLSVAGRTVAFAVGDVIGDTLFCHFEKADVSFEGSYSVIAREFARAFSEGVRVINREEDMGLPGLRKSKLSYNPVRLLEKFNVTVK